MKCRNCKSTVSASDGFCRKCGTPVVFKKRPKRILIWFVSTFAIFLFGAIIFPTDENNNVEMPLWYYWIAFIAPIVIAIFYGRFGYISNTFTKIFEKISLNPFTVNYKRSDFVVPKTKKRQEKLARKIQTHISVCKSIINETDSISTFVLFYNNILTDLNNLSQLHKAKFNNNPSTDYKRLKDEFQWHLCDVIVKAKEKTISEIKGKYKNSIEFQEKEYRKFESEVNENRGRFSESTSALADSSIKEIQNLLGLNPLADKLLENDSYSVNSMDYMEGHQFEFFCADLLRKNGFSNVEVTRGSGDQGVDILAQKEGIKYAVQCKCYSKDLGNKPVQEVNAGKAIYRCQIGAVMTNRYFTQGAKEAAEATGVLLWDRDKLNDMIKK